MKAEFILSPLSIIGKYKYNNISALFSNNISNNIY